MRKLLIILLLLTSFKIKSQTCLLVYDYMETYTWVGNWNTPANTGFYVNYFVSSNVSAALFGTGTGSSGLESAVYILPNVTGLNATYAHKLSFRLGSYKISSSTAATAGVDGPDYVDVRYSTNNGVTAFTEMRIAGNANALWNYNTATAAKTANGTMITYAPTGGGDRTTTGDGYSIIELTIPAGATQLAFNLNCRVNAAGEEWWIDNAELIQLGPCVVLPIELLYFNGIQSSCNQNILTWSTTTQTNNDHFDIERSSDGINFLKIEEIDGAGTSLNIEKYTYIDSSPETGINYYRLKQVDYDNSFTYSKIIDINNSCGIDLKVLRICNLLGQEIPDNYQGVKIIYYSDGSVKKIIK